MKRTLDRLESFDPRSKMFMVRRKVEGQEPIFKLWDARKVLDQGSEGACVGFGCGCRLLAPPVEMMWVDNAYARSVYKKAQTLDPWPGSDYSGTTVNAGLKALKEWGLITGWTWAFTHLDTQLGISYQGPGIAGLNWKTGMFDTDSEGYIHATGVVEGGHCVAFIGVEPAMERYIIQNSWSEKWGRGGRAFLSFSDYEILRSGGEMAFVEGEKDPQAPPPDVEKCGWICQVWRWLTNNII